MANYSYFFLSLLLFSSLCNLSMFFGANADSHRLLRAQPPLLPTGVCSSKEYKGRGLKIVHRYGPCSPFDGERATPIQILQQDQTRVNWLQSRLTLNSSRVDVQDTTIPARPGTTLATGNYIVTVGLGTPKKDMTIVFDTGSDLTWIQCQPCNGGGGCYQQQEPIFNPTDSSSYVRLSCDSAECSQLSLPTSCSSSTCTYRIAYKDRSQSMGFLSRDTLTLSSSDIFTNFQFGCAQQTSGLFGKTAGLLGLGRLPVSIVSQTESKFRRVFSYCLPSSPSSPGYLAFGANAIPSGVKFTPLRTDPNNPSFYFLNMIGISVKGQALPIPASTFASPGTIIDSGTVITRLPSSAYATLRSAFQQEMTNYKSVTSPSSTLDTCYELSGPEALSVPPIVLHFHLCFYLCNEGSRKKQVIIGVSLGSFAFLVASVISLKLFHSWKLEREKDRENQLKVENFLEDYKSTKPTRYSYADLKRMTNQFKDKLGQGGFGSVYKGTLANGNPVAVKILQKSGGDGEDFINEVGTIGRIHHINVVRLLGFCIDNLKRALIYEFMPNESLEKFIFSADAKNPLLSWEKLQDIAIGIARGIEYLHQGCDQRILHFDIKPHNILLDHYFNPKISDFGLAKLCSKGQSIVSMTATRGTMGYIAPEVFSRNFGNVSYKSDVYSFGMLLLEMVGGRKNIDVTVENASQVYFPEWIYDRLHRGEELGLNIVAVEDANIAKKLTTVALWCIQWYPVDRPAMKSVVQMLEGSMESLMMPPNPFASSAPPNVDTTTPETIHVANLTTIAELEEGKEEDIS